ncbi:MAG TPA: hypothetical protein VGH69_19960 [Mycobacterium sp.]|jgi:O-succinylbenzoate synthase
MWAGRLYPSEWTRFRDGLPDADRDGSIVEAYARLLHDPDPRVREKAARDWCDWKASHVSVDPDHRARLPATPTRPTECASHAWSLTAGATPRGALAANYCATLPGSLTFRQP